MVSYTFITHIKCSFMGDFGIMRCIKKMPNIIVDSRVSSLFVVQYTYIIYSYSLVGTAGSSHYTTARNFIHDPQWSCISIHLFFFVHFWMRQSPSLFLSNVRIWKLALSDGMDCTAAFRSNNETTSTPGDHHTMYMLRTIDLFFFKFGSRNSSLTFCCS